MLYKKIRLEKLIRHRNNITKLDFLRKRKFQLLDEFGLKAYDYSKIKVTNGNGKRMTDQERAAIVIEKISNEIKALEAVVLPEQEEIESQIKRVNNISKDWRHAYILERYYVDGEASKDIILVIYGEYTKVTRQNFGKLKETSVELLEKVSDKPFVEIEQIVIDDWKV